MKAVGLMQMMRLPNGRLSARGRDVAQRAETRLGLKGVMCVRKRLSDGSTAVYWYHRASKARLLGEYGSPEFLAAYVDADRSVPRTTETVAGLIKEYLLSPKFDTKLALRTQAEYRRMLVHLEEKFGDLPVKALESPKVRGVFIDYKEQIGRETPREADNRMSVLSAVFSYAFDKGRITRNPIGAFTRLHRADRSDIRWTEADIARFMRGAPVELQRVMILALHTGQRYGDLLRLR